MAPAAELDLDIKSLFRLYAAGEHAKLTDEFLRVFAYFTSTVYLSEHSVKTLLTPLLSAFFALFTQPDYVIPAKHAADFIAANPLLSNLTAMSSFGTTDCFLEIVRHQRSSLAKILTLYSARNAVRFERRKLFDSDPGLASLWYNAFCEIYKTALVRENVVSNLIEHLSYRDERMLLRAGFTVPYFSSTYIDGQLDRTVKPLLNDIVRRQCPLVCRNRANPRKIAVVSDYWFPEHSVYRNYAAFVRELRGDYDLTLIHVLTEKQGLDVSMFDDVHRLEVRDGVLGVEWLRDNDFQVVYFPDVGMTEPSVLMANFRMAPIQICSPGHSASTWGADIDYYVSGADVEIPEVAEQNYSERLVLLPGMGVIHNRPRYQPTGAIKDVPEVVVSCPWSGHKITHRFLLTLRKLVDRAAVPLRLRFFPGTGISQSNGHLPFLRDLRGALGEAVAVDVWPQLPYAEYMRYLEQGDLTLDSFHFAGCNTVADSLFLCKPTIVWQGSKWYNRIGPAMLRQVGLDDLIAVNEEEYLAKALELIQDAGKRRAVTNRLKAVDFDATVFSTTHAPAFRRAVAYLIANHEKLKAEGSKSAIVIA